MRKNAGLMIVTLLLLVVPALANAWTLTVKVAGGSDTNNVKVVYGSTTKILKSGTSYLYPTSAATITFQGAAPSVATLDGNAAVSPVSLSSGSHILSATYAAAATTGFSITQADGGTIYAQNLNNTWTTTGVSGLAAGTVLPVTIGADSNHKIVSYDVGAGAVPVVGGTPGQIISLSVPVSGQTITATYALVAKISATLFGPTTGSTGNAINCNVTATSNDAGLQYAFAVTGPAAFSQAASSTQTFSFTPTLAGTYVVDATVTSTNGGSVVATMNVVVATAQTVLNAGCTSCHSSQPAMSQHSLDIQNTCTNCHSPAPHSLGATCVGCHSIAQNSHDPAHVNDNNGVRSITQEFAKWSHHVTGVTLNDAHCAACHLEGKAVNGEIVVDVTKHLANAQIHLRDTSADTDADFAWDPAAPNHSGMDTFCMSCHDANGAVSPQSIAIQAYINANGLAAAGKTASAKNPFGDTISNRYDKMQRPGVTNVNSQFDTTNNSHHGVKGPRYSGRTRAAEARQIASPATFANNSSQLLQGKRSTMYDAGNLNQLYTPLENAAGEAAPRTGAATLGDDSTLHCGDCHTVGQWKVGSSETANGTPTPAAIGAHGSNNEYMLRNSIGTDERHTQNAFLQGNITGTVLDPTTGLPIPNGTIVYTNPNGAFLVCYNCHNYNKYGSIYLATGLNGANAAGQPHAGEYDAQGRCNGVGNTIPFNGYTTGTATDGTQFASRFMGPVTKYSAAAPYAGEQNPDFGNIFGIQCLNCHNSGLGNAYGGIHGSANNTAWNNGSTIVEPDASVTGGAYIDGMGNTNKVERFLPGLGNAMHVPGTLGGFTGGSVVATATGGPAYTYITGGISNDTNWEQKQWQQLATTVINATTGVVSNTAAAGAGCYTLGATVVSGAAIKTADMTSGLEGPSVTGENGPATEATDVWGGCDDHTAGQGKGNHGFLKRIVRPVTY